MGKFVINKILKNSKGQSAIEYILLLAVIAAIGTTVLNNQKFKDFIQGQNGLFASMKIGMAYSYRFGRTAGADAEEALDYEDTGTSVKHDLYKNSNTNTTHFFTNIEKYPR